MNGFLQLLWAPRNVQVTPVERTALKAGESLPLGTAGRSFGTEAELQISPSKLARVHGRIALRDGTWRLNHTGPELRTLVNGAPVNEAALQHLDVLELPDFGPVFRFFTAQPGGTAPAPELLSLDDAPRLAVWADTLLEANDPLGERLAQALEARGTEAAHPSTSLGTNGATSPGTHGATNDDLRWLGPLARTWMEGRLEVEWKHGLMRRAVMRDLQLFGAEPLTSIDLLLRLPVARYLESLVLDAGGAQSTAQAFVDVLRSEQTPAPKTLTALSLGDVSFADAWADEASMRFRHLLKPRFPNLGPAPFFGRFRRATLVGEKQVQDLGDTAEIIDVAAPAGGTAGVAIWRLQRKHAHWEIEAVPPSPSGITLNGRPVSRAALRDDDQIQLSNGAAYRFKLER